MLAYQRRQQILDRAHRSGLITTRMLCAAYGVSAATARRDLAALHGTGVLRRIPGGAIPTRVSRPPRRRDPDIEGGAEPSALTEMASVAARLAEPEGTLGVMANRFARPLGAALAQAPGLRLVTNSLALMRELGQNNAIAAQVTLLPGSYTQSGTLVGPLTTHATRRMRLDMVLLEADGLTADGLQATDHEHAEVISALISAARRTVLLAPSATWGQTGLVTVDCLTHVDTVISDGDLTAAARRTLRSHGTHVITTT